uniref:Uncharacterized protein n=1 Tax=Ackermannviridae sp. ctkHJ36 TaxID=2825754 RepID=A0A8S5UKA4_9CAUD|nr:MAG TPA: hypothetical protein [Ackermannviridae sp. ctkHJ36]DAQ97958.1 MAG TPA: hypothetical protein [Caudoviricetes sp.]
MATSSLLCLRPCVACYGLSIPVNVQDVNPLTGSLENLTNWLTGNCAVCTR